MSRTYEENGLEKMSGIYRRARARVGVITVGREPYWGQFHGLREELEGYGRQFEQMVGRCDVEVISGGFVDNVGQSFVAAAQTVGLP